MKIRNFWEIYHKNMGKFTSIWEYFHMYPGKISMHIEMQVSQVKIVQIFNGHGGQGVRGGSDFRAVD
jgi:hypothetical protein